jgi:hypothetical protein
VLLRAGRFVLTTVEWPSGPKYSGITAASSTEYRLISHLLEQALSEVKRLPVLEQDAIASLILDELADERRWHEKFARSQDKLASLAAKVREDIRAGRVHSGGFDRN